MVLSGSVGVVLYCAGREGPATLLGRCWTSAPGSQCLVWKIGSADCALNFLRQEVMRSTGVYSPNFGTRCTGTSSACASVSAIIHSSWNGAPESTSHRPITKTKRNGEGNQPDRRAYPRLQDNLSGKVFLGVAFVTSHCAAVLRGPPILGVALGSWLETCLGLAQQPPLHTILSTALWFRLARVSPPK
jgi:hypothetical protein